MSTKHISTENLSTSSAQEVFDFIVAHLRHQGKRAVAVDEVGNSSCKYRIENLKCAAGCLIPDDRYSCEFEGYPWGDVATRLQVFDYHGRLIRDMQALHDSSPVDRWENAFVGVARNYELVLAAR